MNFNLRARAIAEFLGTAFLLAAVVGSGIMGERLSGRQYCNRTVSQHAGYWGDSSGFDSHPCPDFGSAF